MKRQWTMEDLVEHWTLVPSELAMLEHKRDHSRLGMAALLKFYQFEGRFPYQYPLRGVLRGGAQHEPGVRARRCRGQQRGDGLALERRSAGEGEVVEHVTLLLA